jgi:hypothetical protein
MNSSKQTVAQNTFEKDALTHEKIFGDQGKDISQNQDNYQKRDVDDIPPMIGMIDSANLGNSNNGTVANGAQAMAMQPTIQQAMVSTAQNDNLTSNIAQPTIQEAIQGGSTGTMQIKTGINPWNGIP